MAIWYSSYEMIHIASHGKEGKNKNIMSFENFRSHEIKVISRWKVEIYHSFRKVNALLGNCAHFAPVIFAVF